MPYPATIARPASTLMRTPTASSFPGSTRQVTTFPSQLMLQGSTSINEQSSNPFTMFSNSLPFDIALSDFSGSGLANA